MKLLKNIGLPKKFNDADNGYFVEVDEDPNLIYETHLFETNLDFDSAITTLDSFISKHFGASTKIQNDFSCALKWSLANQEVIAQISKDGDYIAGYINSQTSWTWSKP